MRAMQTASEIIDALGGTGVLASTLNLRPSAVSNWRAENRIPSARWPKIADLARAKRIPGVTLNALSRLFGDPGERAA